MSSNTNPVKGYIDLNDVIDYTIPGEYNTMKIIKIKSFEDIKDLPIYDYIKQYVSSLTTLNDAYIYIIHNINNTTLSSGFALGYIFRNLGYYTNQATFTKFVTNTKDYPIFDYFVNQMKKEERKKLKKCSKR